MHHYIITYGITQLEEIFFGETKENVVENARHLINQWPEYKELENQEIIELSEAGNMEFDLVKIKGRVSPTGKEIFGLVTWGIKETIQKAPYLGYQKDITSYESQIRVMSSAGYRFFPANSMIVIS